MKKPISRFIITAAILVAMMGALIYQLGTLTIAQGAELTSQAESRKVKTLAIKGERGKILDRNGVVLAYSETSYNVEFFRDANNRTQYDSVVYTESLMRAIEIIESGGGEIIDTSYIRLNEDEELVFDWGVSSESAIRARYRNYCEAMGFTISDDNYKDYPGDYSKWDLSKWPTAEYAYNRLRALWFIPEELLFEDANKIISIRQEVILNNYRAYEPITIAYDVGLDVVAQIQMHSDDLVGMQVSQSTKRIYPRGESAAHIVGYLTRGADVVREDQLLAMGYTAEQLEGLYRTDENGDYICENGSRTVNMVDSNGLAYSYSDYIGASGIEYTMEAYLTGATKQHQGAREIETNSNGSIIRELSRTDATDGNDLMLTIDIKLQEVCERAAANLVEKIAAEQQRMIEEDALLPVSQQKYSGMDTDSFDTAKTAAIVAMDAKTGDVLALVSYPSYDPNWFIDGLTLEQAEYLFGESAADTTPARNKAISARHAPGSIFKMVTGVAGVAEGEIHLNTRVSDKSPYYYTDSETGNVIKANAPSCWTDYPSNHADLNLTSALTHSCNYFFCDVAYHLEIGKLDEWAGKFGLTSKTNIELPGEATGIVGGQDVLFDNELTDADGELSISTQKTSLPSLIYRSICNTLKELMNKRSMEIDNDAVSRCTLRIMQLQDGSGMTGKGPDIRRIISEELGIPQLVMQYQTAVMDQIMSYLNEIQWKPTLTIRSGYGQGVTLVTPIAVARYMAALANHGTVYNAHIVDRIVDSNGNIVRDVEPSVAYQIGSGDEQIIYNQNGEYVTTTWDEIWAAVTAGLIGVVSPEDHGTAAGAFSEEFNKAGYIERLTGKTGTAQVGMVTVDIENTSWFVTFTPREDPEIVLVVCVPNGYSGTQSASAVEEIFTYYFNKMDASAPETLVSLGGIAP